MILLWVTVTPLLMYYTAATDPRSESFASHVIEEDTGSVEIPPIEIPEESRIIIAGMRANQATFFATIANQDSWAWPCSVTFLLIVVVAIIIWLTQDV
jgi:hypothetical protein